MAIIRYRSANDLPELRTKADVSRYREKVLSRAGLPTVIVQRNLPMSSSAGDPDLDLTDPPSGSTGLAEMKKTTSVTLANTTDPALPSVQNTLDSEKRRLCLNSKSSDIGTCIKSKHRAKRLQTSSACNLGEKNFTKQKSDVLVELRDSFRDRQVDSSHGVTVSDVLSQLKHLPANCSEEGVPCISTSASAANAKSAMSIVDISERSVAHKIHAFSAQENEPPISQPAKILYRPPEPLKQRMGVFSQTISSPEPVPATRHSPTPKNVPLLPRTEKCTTDFFEPPPKAPPRLASQERRYGASEAPQSHVTQARRVFEIDNNESPKLPRSMAAQAGPIVQPENWNGSEKSLHAHPQAHSTSAVITKTEYVPPPLRAESEIQVHEVPLPAPLHRLDLADGLPEDPHSQHNAAESNSVKRFWEAQSKAAAKEHAVLPYRRDPTSNNMPSVVPRPRSENGFHRAEPLVTIEHRTREDYADQDQDNRRPYDNSQVANPSTFSHNGHLSPKDGIVLESIGDTLKTKSKWEQRLAEEKKKEQEEKMQQVRNMRPVSTIGSAEHHWPPAPDRAMTRENGSVLKQELVRTYSEHDRLEPEMVDPAFFNEKTCGDKPQNSKAEDTSKPAGAPSGASQAGDMEQQKTLVMLYMHYRSDVISSLGLDVPIAVKARMSQLAQRLPYRAVLREEYIQEDRAIPTSPQQPTFLSRQAHGSTLSRESRYAKNPKAQLTKKLPVRRTSQDQPVGTGNPAVILRPTGYDNDMGQLSPGESIVAKEICEAEERESELRRSRSQLGLPSLEEVLDFWRNQEPLPHHPIRPVRSYDHLLSAEQHSEKSSLSLNARPISTNGRSNSLTHLHYTSPPDSLSPNSVQQAKFNTRRDESIKLRSPSPKLQEQFSLANAHIQPKLGLASTGNDGRQVAEIAPMYRRTTKSFVPVEARIEAEVEDLRKREDELRRQRMSVGSEVSVVRIGGDGRAAFHMNGNVSMGERSQFKDAHFGVSPEAWREVNQMTMDSRISMNSVYQ